MALRKDGSLVDNFPGQKPTRCKYNFCSSDSASQIMKQFPIYEVNMTREAWFAAIKDFIWARSSELSLSQQNIKGV